MILLFYLLILIKLIISPLSLKFNNFFIYLPDLFFLLFCIILFLKETSRKKIFLLYLIFVLILIVIISSFVNDTSFFNSVQNISRTILPFAILIFLINEPRISLEYNLDKLGIYLCFTVILLSVYAFFNFEPEINRGLILLPSYFGGVHTSSYILLSSFFILFAIYFKNQNNFKIKLFYLTYIILCFYMFSTGWAVRTIFLTFILFFYLYFF